MTIRPTTYADLDALTAIFAYARAQMAADGNPSQWGDGYPTREQLENDIQRGVSYVMEHKGVPCATFVFIIGADPTYQTGAHKSSANSIPKQVSGVSNRRFFPKGTNCPQRRIFDSFTTEAGENQRCSELSLWLGR